MRFLLSASNTRPVSRALLPAAVRSLLAVLLTVSAVYGASVTAAAVEGEAARSARVHENPAAAGSADAMAASTASASAAMLRRGPIVLEFPECLRITGARTVEACAIKRALARDLDLFLASHAVQGSAAGFRGMLADKVLAAYRRLGFLHAGVSVLFDRTHQVVSISIDEGERLDEPMVEVQGASVIEPPVIQKSVMDYLRSTSCDPGGTSAAAFHFDTVSLDAAAEQVRTLYESRGYLAARASVKIADNGLLVNIEKEGPRCIFSGITLQGNKRDDEAAFLDELDIKAGTIVTGALLSRTRERLVRSGRFLDVDVGPSEPDRDGRVLLRIKVEEYDKAPPLSKGFDENARVFLAVRDWFARMESMNEDFVFTTVLPWHSVLKGVVSPRKGIILSLHGTHRVRRAHDGGCVHDGGCAHGACDEQSDFEYHLLCTPGCFTLLRPLASRKCVVNTKSGELTIQLAVGPSANRDKEHSFDLKTGFSLSAERNHAVPVFFDLNLSPVAFLSIPWSGKAKCSSKNGSLNVSGEGENIRFSAEIERSSGRLTGLHLDSVSTGETLLDLSTTTGGFEVFNGIFERKACQCKDNYDVANPLRSTGAFLADLVLCDVLASRVSVKQARAIKNLLVKPVLAGFADGLRSFDASTGPLHSFVIPPAGAEASESPSFIVSTTLWLATADNIFPSASWPRLLAKTITMMLCGRGRLVRYYLTRLQHCENMGPLGCALVSRVIGLFDSRLGAYFLERARQMHIQIGPKADIRFILSVKPVFFALKAVAKALRAADRNALSLVTRLLPRDLRQPVDSTLRILCDDKRGDGIELLLEKALGPALAGLSARLVTREKAQGSK